MNDHLSGKELFIRFSARAFRKLLSIYVFNCFPFGFEGRMWDLIVSVLDHCLSFLHFIDHSLLMASISLENIQSVVIIYSSLLLSFIRLGLMVCLWSGHRG